MEPGSFGWNDREDGFAVNCKLAGALENVEVEVVQVDGLIAQVACLRECSALKSCPDDAGCRHSRAHARGSGIY